MFDAAVDLPAKLVSVHLPASSHCLPVPSYCWRTLLIKAVCSAQVLQHYFMRKDDATLGSPAALVSAQYHLPASSHCMPVSFTLFSTR